jgi:ribose transport system permease protein
MSRRFSFGFEKFSGLYLFAAFIIIFGFWSPDNFLTINTAHTIASQQAVAGMVALALLLPMVCGHFDLSIGAMANLGGMIAVIAQTEHGVAPLPAIGIAVLAGLIVGFVNGLIVIGLRVNSFIATLGMGSVLAAFQTIVTNSQVPLPPPSLFWGELTQSKVFGFQIVVLYLIALAIIIWWILAFTPAGRFMYATGDNTDAARLSGVRTDKWSWISLIASAMLSALAGVLYVSLTGPSLTFGSTFLLPAFAAVFLGSTQLIPGRFNVWGTLIAIVVLATGVTGLQLVSEIQWVQDMFNGVALIVAVALSAQRQRSVSGGLRRLRRRKRIAGEGSDAGGSDGGLAAETGTAAASP